MHRTDGLILNVTDVVLRFGMYIARAFSEQQTLRLLWVATSDLRVKLDICARHAWYLDLEAVEAVLVVSEQAGGDLIFRFELQSQSQLIHRKQFLFPRRQMFPQTPNDLLIECRVIISRRQWAGKRLRVINGSEECALLQKQLIDLKGTNKRTRGVVRSTRHHWCCHNQINELRLHNHLRSLASQVNQSFL